MELSIYLNKKVYITLVNGFNYVGYVVSADENFLTILDKTNKQVSLNKNSISFLKELV